MDKIKVLPNFRMVITVVLILAAIVIFFTYPASAMTTQPGNRTSGHRIVSNFGHPALQYTGTIASLQNDQSGHPAWILSGRWNMTYLFTLPISNVSRHPPAATFNATWTMVMLNGSSTHTHSISNFKLIAERSLPNNKADIFNGTATVTLKDGPHNNVPASVTLARPLPPCQPINRAGGHNIACNITPGQRAGSISIWIDPKMVNNHFGNTPIYGTVILQPTHVSEHT